MALMIISVLQVCDAKVNRQQDSFSGEVIVSTVALNVEDISAISFRKTIGKQIAYTGGFSMRRSEWYFFEPLLYMKADDNVFEMNVIGTDHTYAGKNDLRTYIFYRLTDEQVEAIQQAAAVSYRMYFKKQGRQDILLPGSVLSDWKQVVEEK